MNVLPNIDFRNKNIYRETKINLYSKGAFIQMKDIFIMKTHFF